MGILECRILQTVKRFFWNQYTDFLLHKEQRLDIDACRVWFYQILKKVRKYISLFLYTVVPTSIYETTLPLLHTKSERNVCHLKLGFWLLTFPYVIYRNYIKLSKFIDIWMLVRTPLKNRDKWVNSQIRSPRVGHSKQCFFSITSIYNSLICFIIGLCCLEQAYACQNLQIVSFFRSSVPFLL